MSESRSPAVSMSDIDLTGIVAAARQLRASMQGFAVACARVGEAVRVVLRTALVRSAPCPTCDGTLVAYDWARDYAWCRCRRKWAYEEIVRARPPARVVSDHWQLPERPLAVDDLYKLRRQIEQRPLR